MNTHLVTHSNFLRENLKKLASDIYLKRITQKDYDSSVCTVLEALEKVSEVNIYKTINK